MNPTTYKNMTIAKIKQTYEQYINNDDYVFGTYDNKIIIMKSIDNKPTAKSIDNKMTVTVASSKSVKSSKWSKYLIINIFDKNEPHETHDIFEKNGKHI
jgi:hypothetical protein